MPPVSNRCVDLGPGGAAFQGATAGNLSDEDKEKTAARSQCTTSEAAAAAERKQMFYYLYNFVT